MDAFINGLMLGTIIGLICGFALAVKIKAGGVTNQNEIGKVKTKGDNSPIEAAITMQTNQPKKRGIVRKIFTKKK
jgi:hypothetical protein